ncbi:MAG TPA: NADH:ubiquinone oxidoreductase subunit NDUFA12 [Micropepsaceae bacterium]|nr:NADH:ubiquinone oxidoreductase subunit NDUFA12 [Micropepsaceae bacterium]
MKLLSQIFTWWNGTTLSTRIGTWLKGEKVGEDIHGNRYYRNRSSGRRWVIYKGYAEPSSVPPEWHGWLHHTLEKPPTEAPLPVQAWEQDGRPNMTGTPYAWRPKGSLYGAGKRDAATGDYEPWQPR